MRHARPLPRLAITAATSLACFALIAGCTRESGPSGIPLARPAGADDVRLSMPATETAVQVRVENDLVGDLPAFDGLTAEPVTGRDLAARLASADVIILGETHDDAVGHRLQTRLVQAALPGNGNGGALALEMLERGGSIGDVEGSSLVRWRDWEDFYWPSIQAARRAGRPVIAANAPQEYVTVARVAGFDTLENLNETTRRNFRIPPAGFEADARDYSDRFTQAIPGGHSVSDATTLPASTRPTRDTAAASSFFDAQLLRDATMADSVVDARRRHGGPVVLLVGQFHTDFDGGLTQLVRRYNPRLRVLNVSLVPADGNRLRPEDAGRADVVIYTGGVDAEDLQPATSAPATTQPIGRMTDVIEGGDLTETVPTTQPVEVLESSTPPTTRP